jgi:hypothetical protein
MRNNLPASLNSFGLIDPRFGSQNASTTGVIYPIFLFDGLKILETEDPSSPLHPAGSVTPMFANFDHLTRFE